MILASLLSALSAMDISEKSQERREIGLARYFPYYFACAHDTVLTDQDALGAVFEVTYNDVFDASRDQRTDHCKWISRAENSIGKRVYGSNGWMGQRYALRCEAPPLVMPSYMESLGRRILAQSHIDYMVGKRGRWRHLIALTYLPPAPQLSFFQKFFMTGEPLVESAYADTKAAFEDGVEGYVENMRGAKLRRLGTHPLDPRRNEMLEALLHVLYDEEMKLYAGDPFEPAPIGGLLACRDIYPGRRPKVGDRHMRVLSVKGYNSTTRPDMFDAFLQAPVQGSRFSSRFVFESHEKAKAKLERERSQFALGKYSFAAMAADPEGFQNNARVNRTAANAEERTEQAIETHDSGRVSSGHLMANATLFADTLPEMAEKIQGVRRALTGFVVKLEDINTMRTYFANAPFHAIRARELKAHTGNTPRASASISADPGRKTWACSFCGPEPKASFIMLTRTREDYHIDTHDGQSRGFMLVGAKGSGKTTFMNAMMANDITDENHQVFGYDKNRGMMFTTLFLGGEYRIARRFWLYANLEDKAKRDYLTRFHSNLIDANVEGFRVDRNLVKLSLERMLRDRPSNRNLGTFMAAFSPLDMSPRAAASKVLRDYALGGVHDGVFDGAYDPSENTAQRVVYELGHFMTGNQDDSVAGPVMSWLRYNFKQRYPGHSTKSYCDEWWTLMRNPVIVGEFEEEIRTDRAQHAGTGYSTQSLGDILGAPIADIVMSASPTRFVMPDKDANEKLYGEPGLQLTDQQIASVREAREREDCAMVTSTGFSMFKNLYSPAEKAVFGLTGRDDIDAAMADREAHPKTWQYRLLKKAGCDKEADEVMKLLSKKKGPSPTQLREALSA